MKNYKKYLVIGLFALLIGASVSTIAYSKVINLKTQQTGRNWSDNFDTYTLGQFLDGTPDDGGWKGWDNDPVAGAYVVNTQALSLPHSAEIAYGTDLIHEYSGYTSGQWNYTAWVYVPGDFTGNSYFMLLSDYTDGAGENNKWQFVMRFDAGNQIVESENDGSNLVLITDRWVEIRVEIDLDEDWFQLYYDDNLLVEREWTAGWNGAGDGFLVIDAVDLYAYGSSEIYYDDMILEGEGIEPVPDLDCSGSLSWTDVSPKSTVTGVFNVSNIGEEGSFLNWEVSTWPSWGNWTFTPSSGTGLAKGDYATITVEVVAPADKKKTFTGKIKMINSDNPSDFCEIDITLTTPRAKTGFNILLWILQKYPNMFPILRHILA